MVALISEFDSFVSGLIRLFYETKPDALNASEKTLTLAELSEFGSIDAAREYIIEKEIESVLRKNHSDQFDWLEAKFGLPLRKDLAIWPDFIEITERRNLFVHNDGIVTRHYLLSCQKVGVPLEGIKRGHRLEASLAYFAKAHDVVHELAVKLGHVSWRKIVPTEQEDADGDIGGRILYNLILHGRYELAIRFGEFASEHFKKGRADVNKRMLVINLAQAYKWGGNSQKALDILDKEDWTASNAEFQLAVATLRDNLPLALSLMRQLGAAERPGKSAYKQWPLFQELRKNTEFQKTFEAIFGEPISVVVPEKPDPICTSDATSKDSNEPGADGGRTVH